MIKLKIVHIAIFSFILLISSVLASTDVDVKLSSNDMIGYAGETSSVDIIIKNNQNGADTFTITTSPYQFAGVVTSLEKFIVPVNAGSTETVKLFFTVPMNVEEILTSFTISVKSTSSSISDTENLYFRIVRKTDVYITDLKTENLVNPEDVGKIQIDVANIGITLSGKYSLETAVKKNDVVVKRYDDIFESILPKSSISINNTYKIGKYDEPGVYNVESTLKDNTGKIVSFKTANFNVKVVNVTENLLTEYTQKKSSFNLFSIKTTITTKNEGNVASPSFYVTESVPSIVKFLFDPNIEPSKVTKAEGGRTVYGWLILSLEPGKQATITYNYNIWIIWLSILIIGGLIYVIIRFMYKPSILKTYKHQGKISKEKEVLISLDVRNRTRHEIKDVEVRDIVPSIVKVVERFDTIVPRIKTTEVGTELRWKLDSLKPKEERVLTYRVKPLLEMSGTLNLPKAHVKYFDRKKIKRIIASKAILIQG